MVFEFNETLLNITSSFHEISESSKYVTIESCQAYVIETTRWNIAYQVMIACVLVLLFFWMYKYFKLVKKSG